MEPGSLRRHLSPTYLSTLKGGVGMLNRCREDPIGLLGAIAGGGDTATNTDLFMVCLGAGAEWSHILSYEPGWLGPAINPSGQTKYRRTDSQVHRALELRAPFKQRRPFQEQLAGRPAKQSKDK